MEDMTLCSAEHQEVFRRVWNRVMAGHPETGCPVEVTGDLSCKCLEHLAQTNQNNQGNNNTQNNRSSQMQQPVQIPREDQRMTDNRGSDLPMTGVDLPQDDESTARLRQQVLDALESWQMYRHLARRTRNTNARTLTAMAADQHRQARRLATAYFLLTGLRYWPSETLSTPAIPSFWGTLRQRHQAEQQAELSYRMAADEVTDPTLLELYQQLADGCRNRCRQLRSLLEQSCP